MPKSNRYQEVVQTAQEYGVSCAAMKYGLKESTVERYVRALGINTQDVTTAPTQDKPILAIPDTHCPFMHKNAVDFLKDVYAEYNCGQVIHLGDIADFHSISRHTSEPDAMGAVDEFDAMLEQVGKIVEAFPEATLCTGNHDDIPVRQAKFLGIPRTFLRDLASLLELPDGWDVVESIIIDGVKYYHGIGSGGKHGAYNAAVQQMQSVVIGHTHTNAGVRYHANDNRLIFGAAGGCLIDIDKYAFEYQRAFTVRPILGCTVVFSSERAEFIPMDLRRYK